MSDDKQLPATSIAGVDIKVINDIRDIQKKYSITALVDCEAFEKSLMIAEGIGRLTQAIAANPKIVKLIMYMQGKKLGFRTDKVYDEETCINVFVEATIRGLQLSGNQFNIIAGNFYQTKEGWEALIESLPELTDWFLIWGDFDNVKGTAKVNFEVSWQYKGVEDKMIGWVPVRVNSGMIADAVYGKAERKVMARVYKKITKSSAYFDEKDINDIDTSPVNQGATSRIAAGDGKISGNTEAKEPGKWNNDQA